MVNQGAPEYLPNGIGETYASGIGAAPRLNLLGLSYPLDFLLFLDFFIFRIILNKTALILSILEFE
jgi:hypothetical protein